MSRAAVLCAVALAALSLAACAWATASTTAAAAAPAITWGRLASDELSSAEIVRAYAEHGRRGVAVAILADELSAAQFHRLAGARSEKLTGGALPNLKHWAIKSSRSGMLADRDASFARALTVAAASPLVVFAEPAVAKAAGFDAAAAKPLSSIKELRSMQSGHVVVLLSAAYPETMDRVAGAVLEMLHERADESFVVFTSNSVPSEASDASARAGTRSLMGVATAAAPGDVVLQTSNITNNMVNGLLIGFMLFVFVFIAIKCLFAIEPQEEFAEGEEEEKKIR